MALALNRNAHKRVVSPCAGADISTPRFKEVNDYLRDGDVTYVIRLEGDTAASGSSPEYAGIKQELSFTINASTLDFRLRSRDDTVTIRVNAIERTLGLVRLEQLLRFRFDVGRILGCSLLESTRHHRAT